MALDDLHCLIRHKTQPNQILYVQYIRIKIIWY